MQTLSSYTQPLTNWLSMHPRWGLIITFLVAFTESLAIIGSIIPGSITMTAIGILAGSGILRIDLTLVAAILGAMAGDSASYLLGYTFKDRLIHVWPFKRYPSWLALGKDYFTHHGGKSVVLGRFIGPLRSIIPVIAGMMGMSQWRFFIANALSAIGWSILYVLPGVFIGAASSGLSQEVATRLFIIILLLLAKLWLLTLILKWLLIRLNLLLRKALDDFWCWLCRQPVISKIAKRLTPADESNHSQTALLSLLWLFSTLGFFLLLSLTLHGSWVENLNQSVYLFLQSLRTPSFDTFFIIISQISSLPNLIAFAILITLVAIYYRDWRSLAYWLSLSVILTCCLFFIYLFIDNPRPQGILESQDTNSFPIFGLSFSTAFFSAFIFFIHSQCHLVINRIIKIILIIGLFLSGLAPLYLGDNWITDSLGAYLLGFSLFLLHWLFYRSKPPKIRCTVNGPLIIILLLTSVIAIMGGLSYQKSLRKHQLYLEQYVLSEEIWWNQTTPLLPVYRMNRIGKPVSVFNIQYLGYIAKLEQSLTQFGWQKLDASLLKTVVTKLSDQKLGKSLPLLAQLYLNRKPVLIMIYQPKNSDPIQILRIWRSNYHIKQFPQPLWIGSVHPYKISKTDRRKLKQPLPPKKSISYVSMALPQFLQRQKYIAIRVKIPIKVEPFLLLIKEPLVETYYWG